MPVHFEIFSHVYSDLPSKENEPLAKKFPILMKDGLLSMDLFSMSRKNNCYVLSRKCMWHEVSKFDYIWTTGFLKRTALSDLFEAYIKGNR